MKRVVGNVLVLCVPMFIMFIMFSQMRTADVVDVHNTIMSVSGIRTVSDSNTDFGVGLTLVPGAEPIIELMSITRAFNYNTEVLDEFKETSSKVYDEELNSVLKYTKDNGTSFYTKKYSDTIISMCNYFKSYSEFGSDSEVTRNMKVELNSNISSLKMIVIMKIVLFLIMLVLSITGFIVWRVRVYSK